MHPSGHVMHGRPSQEFFANDQNFQGHDLPGFGLGSTGVPGFNSMAGAGGQSHAPPVNNNNTNVFNSDLYLNFLGQ